METPPDLSNFTVIFVLGKRPSCTLVKRTHADVLLGAPGARKGTLCQTLAQTYNLAHHSIGDGLRSWMRANCDAPPALQIQDELDKPGLPHFDGAQLIHLRGHQKCFDPD
jgi:hypothetical protein